MGLLTVSQAHPTIGSPLLWGGFLVFVLVMLALDLGIFHRKAHIVGYREALTWSGVWIALSLLFGAGVWWYDHTRGIEFVTGYLIEKSLSVDNIFVFVMIFGALGIPRLYQHRVLFWGILFALVLRAAMIFAGTAMLAKFEWLIYVFGAFLVITGIKILVQKEEDENPEDGWVMRSAKRFIPTTSTLDGEHFFTKENGRRLATPLFMALVLVEVSDVVFAVDSIPAIFAITRDPFIVFTSNIFAILGLRSLFFLLAEMVDKFRYLKIGLAFVLMFVGSKMLLLHFHIKLPALVSLGVILGTLAVAVIASLWAEKREKAQEGT